MGFSPEGQCFRLHPPIQPKSTIPGLQRFGDEMTETGLKLELHETWPGEPDAYVVDMSNRDSKFEALKSSSFDPAALWARLNGDLELLRELVQIFSREHPRLLENISAAIERGSCEDVRKFSHKLKGSALQFSGSGVATLAASLEQMGEHRKLEGAARVFSDLEREVANLAKSLHSMAEEERQAGC